MELQYPSLGLISSPEVSTNMSLIEAITNLALTVNNILLPVSIREEKQLLKSGVCGVIMFTCKEAKNALSLDTGGTR